MWSKCVQMKSWFKEIAKKKIYVKTIQKEYQLSDKSQPKTNNKIGMQ